MGKKRKSLPPMIRQDMKAAAQKLVEHRMVEKMPDGRYKRKGVE